MKIHLTLLTFLFFKTIGFAQNLYPSQTNEIVLNLNDTTYCRIFNGTIVQNNYVIKEPGTVQYITNKEKIKELGIRTTLPLMIINLKSFPIEYKIDSILYSRTDFISSIKFPGSIQLPVSINGKLLTYEERQSMLSKLEINEIRDIRYLDSSTAMKKYGVTPFGLIDLVID